MSSDNVQTLVEETVTRYCSPTAKVTGLQPVPMEPDERGWSGAEIRRYRVSLDQGDPISLLTKTMPYKERRVLHLLSLAGHAHVPFAYTDDLTTDAPITTCMQDLGSRKIGLPTGRDETLPSDRYDPAVARALAEIHVPYLGQREHLAWLPSANQTYVTDFLVKDVWRAHWETALSTDSAFAAEFGRYTPPLEKAAEQFAQTVQALWEEGDCLTLTHGEIHGDHVLLYRDAPYFIDWGWTYYGPFYLDLPAFFTPQTVHLYRYALAEQGLHLPEAHFMERFRAVGRYVGFKYLCSGIWQWSPGPTAVTGQRILLTIKWAVDGVWPERAFAISRSAWHQLMVDHERFVASGSATRLP